MKSKDYTLVVQVLLLPQALNPYKQVSSYALSVTLPKTTLALHDIS